MKIKELLEIFKKNKFNYFAQGKEGGQASDAYSSLYWFSNCGPECHYGNTFIFTIAEKDNNSTGEVLESLKNIDKIIKDLKIILIDYFSLHGHFLTAKKYFNNQLQIELTVLSKQ
jgi:hypothetical protein